MSANRVALSISGEVYERLVAHCAERRISISAAVTELIEPVLRGEIPPPTPEAPAARAVRTRRARGQLPQKDRDYERKPTSTARVAAHLMQLGRCSSLVAARTLREVTGLRLSSSAVRAARLKLYGGNRG